MWKCCCYCWRQRVLSMLSKCTASENGAAAKKWRNEFIITFANDIYGIAIVAMARRSEYGRAYVFYNLIAHTNASFFCFSRSLLFDFENLFKACWIVAHSYFARCELVFSLALRNLCPFRLIYEQICENWVWKDKQKNERWKIHFY